MAVIRAKDSVSQRRAGGAGRRHLFTDADPVSSDYRSAQAG
jgi:hypothetical protein